MGTIPHPEPDETRPSPPTLAKAIPIDTPAPRLHALEARYGDTSDPVVLAMPPTHRDVLLGRIPQLLQQSEPLDGAA
jgi:hypothetical protein